MKMCGAMMVCALMLSYLSSVSNPQHSQPLDQCCQKLEQQRKPHKHLEPRSHSDGFPAPNSAFIHRFRRSPKRKGFFRNKMSRKKQSHDEREKGKGRACALRHIQLKVTDLGLGYRSQEELIFSYCSGVCINSLTNYDKILTSLAGSDKNILPSSTPTACCRPVEYDDDLSFLDDDLIYHTMERHSARKCGCV